MHDSYKCRTVFEKLFWIHLLKEFSPKPIILSFLFCPTKRAACQVKPSPWLDIWQVVVISNLIEALLCSKLPEKLHKVLPLVRKCEQLRNFLYILCFRVFRVSKTVSWLIAHWIPDSLVCNTPLIKWYYRWLLVNWVKLYVCLRLCFTGNVWNQCTWVDFCDKRISKPQIYALIIDIQWTSSLSDTPSRSISIRQSIQIYLISKSIVPR